MAEIITLILFVALLTGILIYCLLELPLAFHYLRYRKNRITQHSLIDEENCPPVTIQLPVFNEKYVVERLIDKICLFNYPKDKLEIQVLDDSTDETLQISENKVAEYRALGFDIKVIHRTDRTGYKAGALQNGMQQCRGEFIAIFDADFLPNPDFLLLTLPHFQNEKIGVVQTRWGHLNKDYSLLTRVQAFFLDAHFTVEQAGRFSRGYFMNFNGTAGIWRKDTIIDAGGWQADTLTEDLDLSYRAQMRGWQFAYLETVHSPAELPADMPSFKSQQFRWIKGGAETARKILPQIVKTDLPFSVKKNAFIHLLSSSVYLLVFALVIVSLPMLWFKNTFIPIEYNKFGIPYLISTIAIIFYFYAANKDNFNQKGGFSNYLLMLPIFLITTMGLSLHNALAALRGLLQEKTPFIRTPKMNIINKQDNFKKKNYLSRKIDKITILEGLLTLYFLAGMYLAFIKDDFSLFPLHLMAFLGFGFVFFFSVKHAKV